MSNGPKNMAFVLVFLLGCTPTSSPESFVGVPASDNTPPTAVAMDVYDPDIISFSATSQPTTIIAVSDVVTVLASARDDDGGIRAVRMWATYTYYKPGQISGPGLVQAPVAQSVSTAIVGDTTLKSRIIAFNFDLKSELGGWSRIKVDVWIEGENFYGGAVHTPVVSITYPTRQDGDTDYMAFCRRRRVPIPPDFALSGTAWVEQGKLQTNLLDPGGDAFVWTYSDPVRRGACIALPRGSGGQRGGLSGIICQSATTGNACFWDSRLRDNNDPLRQMPAIDWSSQPVRISELKDASNLTEQGSGTCTDCHRGNNVFLISPDDPTWEMVLELSGPLGTSPGTTFTTHVEASSDMSGGHPRYIPVTYPSNRPDWVNTHKVVEGLCASCHENPDRAFTATLQMPPICATDDNPENCYK